jgi:type IV pilus assembly protein PilV
MEMLQMDATSDDGICMRLAVSMHGAERASRCRSAAAGFTILEVLITLVLLSLGLLGIVALQGKAQRAAIESYERVEGLILIQDMVERINANRAEAFSLAYVTSTAVGGGGNLTDCGAMTGAAFDLCDWGNRLKGSAEVATSGACSTGNGAGCAGAMPLARGCITYDATTELADSTGAVQAGTGLYTISVAWEGSSATYLPNSRQSCGAPTYGMRAVSSRLRIAALGAQ